MSIFAIRVELHHATAADYERLHLALAAIGLRRSGEFGGVQRALPTAEYETDGPSTLGALELCNRVRVVAETVKANPEVVVTRSADRAAAGLRVLPAAPYAAITNALSRSFGLNAAQPSSTRPGNALLGLVSPK